MVRSSKKNDVDKISDADGLKLIIDCFPIAMLMVSGSGMVVIANARVEELFGYPRADLLDLSVDVLLCESECADQTAIGDHFLTQIVTRASAEGKELFGRRKDGTLFAVEVRLTELEFGGEQFIVASVVDLTERKELEARRLTEQALRESEERWSLLVSGVKDFAVILLDRMVELLVGMKAPRLLTALIKTK